MNQKEIVIYLKQVSQNCPFPFRKRLIDELKSDLFDYLEENPNCTMAEITERFGSPENFAYAYILAMDDAERHNAVKQLRWTKWCVLAGVMACVFIWIASTILMVHDNSMHAIYYYEEIVEYNNIDMEGSNR